MWLDMFMSATEIHNFLLTLPGVAAMRALLDAEGVAYKGVVINNKAGLEGLILDLYVARRGY